MFFLQSIAEILHAYFYDIGLIIRVIFYGYTYQKYIRYTLTDRQTS